MCIRDSLYADKYWAKTVAEATRWLGEYQEKQAEQNANAPAEEEKLSKEEKKKKKEEREQIFKLYGKDYYNEEYQKKNDLSGRELVETLKPAEEIFSFAKRLFNVRIDDPKTNLTAYTSIMDVIVEKKKLVIAVRAVKDLVRVNGKENPRVHLAIVKLLRLASQSEVLAALDAGVREVIEAELNALVGNIRDPLAYNQTFKSSAKSVISLFYALKADIYLGKITKANAGNELVTGLSGSQLTATLKDLFEVLSAVKNEWKLNEVASSIAAKVKERFPLAVFL
eukprot:TRINITY_DN6870_c0_g1_i4.p1 TRINITY_DN6870_c0_g1~~TRINITY_DN6870_c0_g1_i4.p1  ORF type:complete len:282 (-),score=115.31 TRINITY_DN6870_c0_g1_i4:60-905(-)